MIGLRSLRRLTAAAVLVGTTLVGSPARAWDPSTTHVGMTQEAVLRSAMHVRWMDQSGLTRGVFTPIRLHPDDLDPEVRRALTVALRRVHEASGAAALGGPGACPGPSAPPQTQARCVDGDVWELTALGWLKLGVILETAPRTRLLHHFANGTDAAAPTWSDPELPAAVLRAKSRRSEGALARSANRSAFSGGATSAVAWLADTDDRWAPPATVRHLQRASTETDARGRDRELALGLLGLGALLHVVQDQSVPAHARGDLTAFFAPLSPARGDRGLPLQEFVRVLHGRARLPRSLALLPRGATGAPRTGIPLAPSLHEHLLGHGAYEGLTRFTARRFWSESSLPPPRAVSVDLDPEAAATAVLAGESGLAAEEIAGARLAPWPSSAGYLVSSTGRGLAAFDTDPEGRVRLFLDRRVYRDQAAHLIPAGVDASASILDLMFPEFPPLEVDFDTGVLDLDVRGALFEPVLTVLLEDDAGVRTPRQRIALRPEQRNHVVDAFPVPLPENARLVLLVEGRTAPEHGVDVATVAYPRPPAPPAPVIAPTAESPSEPEPQPADPPTESTVPGPAAGTPGEVPRGPSQNELISPFGTDAPPAEPKSDPNADGPTPSEATPDSGDPAAPAPADQEGAAKPDSAAGDDPQEPDTSPPSP